MWRDLLTTVYLITTFNTTVEQELYLKIRWSKHAIKKTHMISDEIYFELS